MRSFLKDLANYNFQCNEKLVDAFYSSGGLLPDRSRQLFSHLLNSHHIWNSRIKKETPLFMPWDDIKDGKFKEINTANLETTQEIIDQFDPEKIIAYSNTRGEKFSNKVLEILYHIFNHSTYHRAQIVTDLKSHGLEAINTDYIFYKRSLEPSI